MNLRADHLETPLAVPSAQPRLSWEIVSDERAVVQTGCQVTVVATSGEHAGEVFWDSGPMRTRATAGIRYGGRPLASLTAYEWTVASRLSTGEQVTASAWFETGPDGASWDAACWIARHRPPTHPVDHHPAPYLRRRFAIAGAVARARLYVTAGGLFHAEINGGAVTLSDLGPGWTDYRFRVPYHAFDVTDFVRSGENTIGAVLGEGWYSGYYGPFGKRAYWGEVPVLRCVLVVDGEDGSRESIVTDGAWECATGPVLLAELLHGQTYDRRLELDGWSEGSALGEWSPVEVTTGPAGRLVPAKIAAAGAVREVKAVGIAEPLPGTYVVDFGQNLAGRVRITAAGPAGTAIRLRHSEILNGDGTLYVDNLRTARATDVVVLNGFGDEVFEPRFTFHGFRYVEVSGYPGRLSPEDVTAVAVASIPWPSLEFETDSPLLNRIQQNLQWTMTSNFLEVPTDCPNRDERLGWGGDAQMFAPTAMYNGDVEAFFDKWLDDIADAQKPSGAFADIAPDVIVDFAEEGAAGYADAGVFLPWDLYRHYGDTAALQDFLERAEAWLRYIAAANPDHVWRNRRNADYGDWLATVPTDKALTATAYWAHAAQTVARYADVLGREEDAACYRALHARIAAAFRREFVVDEQIVDGTQTAQILAIAFGLLTPEQTRIAQQALCDDVERRGHITTGFLAVSHAYQTLSAAGRPDLALRSLLRTEPPSLGAQIERGLTTIGEHWSAWGDDGELLDPWMNSFNHFALGSVAAWAYAAIGGVAPAEPGFYSVAIAPETGGAIRRSRLAMVSPRGPIRCEWSREGDALAMRVEIPANTTATVRLPHGDATESGRDLAAAPGVTGVSVDDGALVVEIGSGSYSFEVARIAERAETPA